MKNLLFSLLFIVISSPVVFANLPAEPLPMMMEIDLELQIDSPPSAAIYSNYPVTLTLQNKGPATATGIVVRFAKPLGVVYAGGNEYTATTGAFHPYDSELWTVSSLDSGAIATLTVNYFLLQNDLPIAYAEIISANEPDTDSTPDNGTPPNVNEDDEASSVAPVICTGDVFLQFQSDVDAFAGCSVIEGGLFIQPPYGVVTSDITDLSPLLSLTKVTGSVVLAFQDKIKDLHGFENLEYADRLVITNCDSLENIDQLSNLSNELVDIQVMDNNAIKNLSGLKNVAGVTDYLGVHGNPELKTFDGLSNISVIDRLWIYSNPKLTALNGLDSLTSVGVSFVFVESDSLTHVNELSNFTIAGEFIMNGHPELTDISALQNLATVNGYFSLNSNHKLSDCCVFNDLIENGGIAGNIFIENNAPNCNSKQEIIDSCNPIVCTGDVILESQADVDAFAGCLVIDGDFIIGGADISDLTPLAVLKEIKGGLYIMDNPVLNSLMGLENLEEIEALFILNNASLTNLQPLSNLSSTETQFMIINNNPGLVTLSGLEGLTSIDGSINIIDNENLQSLEGLNNLKHVDLELNISDNDQLPDLNDLESLQSVGRNLYIIDNDNLIDISALSQLTSVEKQVVIAYNSQLENLNGLENFQSSEDFFVQNNNSLLDISALSGLTAVDDLYVFDNPQLSVCCDLLSILNSGQLLSSTISGNNAGCNSINEIELSCPPDTCYGDVILETQADVDAFAGCSVVNGLLKIGVSGVLSDIHDLSPLLSVTEVNGSLIVLDNDSLLNLEGLNNITHVDRLLFILNDNLENIQALSNLAGEMDELWIWDNVSLKNLDGLEGITGLSQSFELSRNLELENIDGLSGLEYVRQNAWFFDNPSLVSIAGLKKLTSVGDVTGPSSLNSLTIADCNALQSLDGLDNLVTTAKFVITRNAMLQDVSSVKSLEQVREVFLISENPLLEDCCIFYDLLNNNGVEGTVTIEDNAGLCNSPTDILTNCQPLGIDLELTMSSPNSADIYTTYPVELTLTNTGGIPATGIQIEFAKPAGVVYSGGNPYSLSAGSFNPYGNQVWTINSLEANASATLTVNYFLLQNEIPTAYAQVVAANEDDEDSTPNNGTPPLVNEDDEASSESEVPVVCVGDVILESQEDVNNFQGCTIIDGMLRISRPNGATTSDITDLSPLESLTKVTGSIIIEFQDRLKDLHGMQNIAHANRLVVVLSDSLKTLQGLSGLTGVMEEIIIMDNLLLEDIDGLEGIKSLSHALLILSNAELKNLDGFSNLTDVGVGDTMPFSVTQITSNPALVDVSGLRKLREVGEDFIFAQNDALQSANGLGSLKKVGKFIMSGNDLLTDVSALTSLETVETDFIMGGNPLLEDCCVFYNLINNNGVGGTYFMQDNAGNCNSPADILANCVPTGDIDISLTMFTSDPDPAIYTSVPITLTVTNDGPLSATGVSVSFPKPTGTVYTGGNEYSLSQGTFNPFGSEVWEVGDLPAGGTASITVRYFLLNEDEMTPYAQIISHNEQDIDSAPDNGICCSPAEDDEAALTLNGFQPGSGLQLTTRQNRFRLSIDEIYPNPSKYFITMEVFAHEAGTAVFDFYNATGQSVHRIEMDLEKGENEVRVDVYDWRSGTYTVIGQGLGHPAYGRFLKVWE